MTKFSKNKIAFPQVRILIFKELFPFFKKTFSFRIIHSISMILIWKVERINQFQMIFILGNMQ